MHCTGRPVIRNSPSPPCNQNETRNMSQKASKNAAASRRLSNTPGRQNRLMPRRRFTPSSSECRRRALTGPRLTNRPLPRDRADEPRRKRPEKQPSMHGQGPFLVHWSSLRRITIHNATKRLYCSIAAAALFAHVFCIYE